MKKTFSNSAIAFLTTIVVLPLVSCSKDKLITNESAANKKAVGRWQLTDVTSGWVGKVDLPTEKVELAIDENQQGIIYVDGSELLRFNYLLEESASNDLLYTITQQKVKSRLFNVPEKGYFRLKAKQLIIGDTQPDGLEYTFNR